MFFGLTPAAGQPAKNLLHSLWQLILPQQRVGGITHENVETRISHATSTCCLWHVPFRMAVWWIVWQGKILLKPSRCGMISRGCVTSISHSLQPSFPAVFIEKSIFHAFHCCICQTWVEHPWRKFKHPASPWINTGTMEMWPLHLLRRPDLPVIKNLAEKNKMSAHKSYS